MLRRVKVPEREEKEFDQELFEREKDWIIRRREGIIKTSSTKQELKGPIINAIFAGILIGGSLGILVSFLTSNMIFLAIFVVIVSLLVFIFGRGEYASVEVDADNRKIRYNGIINFAGEMRNTRYFGPIEVVDLTQLVQHRFFKNKRFIRLATNSGYFRLNYRPDEEEEFLKSLEVLELYDLKEMQEAVEKQTILRSVDSWDILYELKFDRSAFKRQLREERKRKQEEEELEKKKRREELISKSKKRSAKEKKEEN